MPLPLVDSIYDAVVDDAAYAALPQILADAVRARSCTFQIIRGQVPIHVGAAYFTSAMSDYYLAEQVYHFDLWHSLVAGQALYDRVLMSDDLVSRQAFRDSAFFNDFFRVFGDDTGVSLGSVLRTRSGEIGLGLHRAITAEGFEEADRAILAEALPHLRRMVEIRDRLATSRAATASLQAMLDGVEPAILTTDAQGHVKQLNATAEAMLRRADAVTVRVGVLTAVDIAARDRLAILIRQAASAVEGRGGALNLPRPEGHRPCRLLIAPHQPPGAVTGCLILIDDPHRPPPDLRAVLRALYGLSPAEADLTQRLAEGLSLEEAAEARQSSLLTAQTQLKSIRAKTGTRRQADLLALCAGLPRFA